MVTSNNSLITTQGMRVDIDQNWTQAEIDRARVQAAKLVAICITAYPNSDKYHTEQAVENAVNLWANFFADDDWRIVGLAVKKHVATSKWPPSIAEIREIMTEIQCRDLIPPDEAWAVVARYMDVTGEFGSCENPERLFPPLILRAINAIGYRNLRDLRIRRFDHSGKKTGLDRVAFIQAYEPEYERERTNAMLPPHLRKGICEAQKALSGENRAMLERTNEYLSRKEVEKREIYNRAERNQYALWVSHSGSEGGGDSENNARKSI